jgi:hypothetical protein
LLCIGCLRYHVLNSALSPIQETLQGERSLLFRHIVKFKLCTICVSTVSSSYTKCTGSLPSIYGTLLGHPLPRIFAPGKRHLQPPLHRVDQKSGPVPPHHFSYITQITIIHPAYLKPVCRGFYGVQGTPILQRISRLPQLSNWDNPSRPHNDAPFMARS